MSTQGSNPQPDTLESLLEAKEKMLGQELGRDYYLTRIAHDAAALDLTRRQAQMAENLARQTQEVLLGKSESAPVEDDMGVNVGNTITNNYYPGQASVKTPVQQSPVAPFPQATAPEPTADPLWKRVALAGAKYVLPAAAAAGGAYWLAQPGEQPPAVEQPAGYLEYGVDVGPPANAGEPSP